MMRYSTAVVALASFVGAKANGTRVSRVAKSSKSGSAGSMDAGSWWGPAPAPATWGPAPTWAAPAPTGQPADAGCRAIWLSGVSDSTFDSSICTLSGYYTKKFALKGSLNADNTITIGSEGYDSLEQIGAVYDFNGGAGKKFNPNRATLAESGNEGFFNDISVVGAMNPIGINAANYCQCVAVAVNACKPPVKFAAIPKKDTLNFKDPAGFLSSVTGDLNDEYTSVDQHINEALELDGSDTFRTVDNDKESGAILAIFKSLPSKLDKCASLALSVIY